MDLLNIPCTQSSVLAESERHSVMSLERGPQKKF